MVVEILSEVLHHITEEPGPVVFAAEVIQFAILIGLVYFIGWGRGDKPGFVRNMLSERVVNSKTQLEHALSAEGELEHATQMAALKVRTARSEGRQLLAEAKKEAAEIDAKIRADADAEAERVLSRVDDALAVELAEMNAEVREELVDIVGQATRQLLNERLTVAEQRRLIEEHIMSSMVSGAAQMEVSASEGAQAT